MWTQTLEVGFILSRQPIKTLKISIVLFLDISNSIPE